MKLLVLLSRIPYPLEKGDKLRAWHQLIELSKEHEIHLLCLYDSKIHPDAYEKLKPYCKEIQFYQLSKIGIAARLFLALFTNKPFQVHYFHSYFIQRKINRYVERIKPDHVFAQLIRVSEYVKNIHHIPKTLDYMDALSKGMERRIAKSKGITRIFQRKEAKRLLEYENLIFDYFENKTIISLQDRNHIYHPDQKKISIVRNGVDTSYFSASPIPKKFDLLFNGNMSYPPNVDCALFIANEILPLLDSKGIKVKFLISGASPINSIKNLEANPAITVSGWKEDIRNAYDESRIFIAPMQIGTGLQNKLLEAMAMGLPCITTQLANNALDAKPGEEILIGNTPQEIVEQIDLLLTDKNLYQKLAANGRKMVVEKYDWKSATEILNNLFKNSIK
jgi:polysaccharide biosynthesis protein PslH